MADIVDNSIAAKARHVRIQVEFEGENSYVRIADDGSGMNPHQIREALRFGSNQEYEEDALGKFGLGLKTASLSQCRCLSVASRWNTNRADITAYKWDLEHIATTDRWEILPVADNVSEPAIRDLLKSTTGTVVLWQGLDRILGYKHPYGDAARKHLAAMTRSLEQHLAMVFHRFLTGEVRKPRIHIYINDNEVNPWDPFGRGEEKTKVLDPITLEINEAGYRGSVLIQPYILPKDSDYSTQEAFKKSGGPKGWNEQQGLYIYRAGRMLQSGGWSRLRKPDEHTKLARVSISFTPKLDEAFKVNVAKMRVQIPSEIRDQVDDAIKPVIKLAREVYDRKLTTFSPTRPSPQSSNHQGRNNGPEPPSTPDTNNRIDPAPLTGQNLSSGSLRADLIMRLDEIEKMLLMVASDEERSVVKKLIKKLKMTD